MKAYDKDAMERLKLPHKKYMSEMVIGYKATPAENANDPIF